MAGPRKVSQEEYDEFRSRMEEMYGYDDMSEEEKETFDRKIDQVAVVDQKTHSDDETEDDEVERGERGGGSGNEAEDTGDE